MDHRDITAPALVGRPSDPALQVHYLAGTLTVTWQRQALLALHLHPAAEPHSFSGTVTLLDATLEHPALLAACEGVFTLLPAIQRLLLDLPPSSAVARLIADGVLRPATANTLLCEAQSFWQIPEPWLNKPSYGAAPLHYTLTATTRHPQRPPARTGVLYRRFIPWLGQTFSLEQADPDRDLGAFSRWMNTPRVAHFWEEQGTPEQHHAYLLNRLADAHARPLIGRFDDQPFGYFEVYWAKEDRIAPFYDAGDYDRGLHLLVGEEACRGKRYYTAWFSSLCHYLFLDDPRTERIVCEPRHDNQRQIANFDRNGFAKLKHFDFPHKRALLVMLTRERFFSERLYQPMDDVQPTE
jgi:RimJ/RimL family protein N-acetyltransferase